MRRLFALVVLVFMLFSMLFVFMNTPADSASSGCQITAVKDGNTISLTGCGQSLSFDVNEAANGALGTIAAPTNIITQPPKVIVRTAPTVTVKPKPITVTKTARVSVPGPTKYVAGPTRIKYVDRVQVREVTRPIPGPTRTITVSPSGQPDPTRDTIEDVPPHHDFFSGDVNFNDGETTIAETGVGLLTALGLIMVIFFAMNAGYVLGYKNKENKDTKLMRAVLDSVAVKRKH